MALPARRHPQGRARRGHRRRRRARPADPHPGRPRRGTTLIEYDHVSLRHGERLVLDDVTLALPEHRVALIGANGSGKSSLVRCTNLLHRPDTGAVRVHGVDAARETRRVRRLVGFLFSSADDQIVMPTVREDLAFSFRGRRLPGELAAQRIEESLAWAGLAGHADHPCHLLSGGQKQMLALASLLLLDPAVVIADEPTTLLDLRNRRRLAEALLALPQQLLMVTHHLDLAALCERVVVLDEGRVVADGAPGEAIAFYERLMGG